MKIKETNMNHCSNAENVFPTISIKINNMYYDLQPKDYISKYDVDYTYNNDGS